MKFYSKWCLRAMLIIAVLSQSGCSLFALPGQLIGGAAHLAGAALGVAQTLPMPPPWMF